MIKTGISLAEQMSICFTLQNIQRSEMKFCSNQYDFHFTLLWFWYIPVKKNIEQFWYGNMKFSERLTKMPFNKIWGKVYFSIVYNIITTKILEIRFQFNVHTYMWMLTCACYDGMVILECIVIKGNILCIFFHRFICVYITVISYYFFPLLRSK